MDYRGDFRRQGDYGRRNNYRELNQFQNYDYGDRFRERQEEDYGDRFRERNCCCRKKDEETQQKGDWKKADPSAGCGSKENVGKLSKVSYLIYYTELGR